MAQTNCISVHDKAVLNSLFNPELPFNDAQEEISIIDEEEETPVVLEARRYELDGVKAAESGDLVAAIDFFNKAIEIAPQRASGYNNRAQALRLKGDVPGALADLDLAVKLSSSRGKSGCQAHVQRGLIRRLEGNEEGAFADFKIAANLGSEFAKQMVVQLNPYAALCNQMLSEVIGRMRRGEDS